MKVFVSFNNKNEGFVDQLNKGFRDIGITPASVNLQRTLSDGIFGGLDQILRNINYAFVVLSNAYVEEKWFTTELYALMGKEMSYKSQFVVPILLEDCDVPDFLKDRIAADFRNSFDEGMKQLLAFISEKRRVFVVMKFGDNVLDSAYRGAIKFVAEEFKYSVLRIDEIQDSGNINNQILQEITRSELVIADLTDDRPNCYYEVGYAHASEIETILTRRKGNNIPFDLAGNRFITWETEEGLRAGLRKRFESIQNRNKADKA